LIAHNTFVAWQGAVTVQVHRLLAVQSNNNLWISVADWMVWENGNGGDPDWRTNLDYDGFDWGSYQYAFKWGSGIRYVDLPSFVAATGLQQHGIHIDRATCFETFDVPGPSPMSVPPQHMTLRATCNAVNAGIVLPNINDGYEGSAPDLGAYEVGQPLPEFGPRSKDPVLAPDGGLVHVDGGGGKGDGAVADDASSSSDRGSSDASARDKVAEGCGCLLDELPGADPTWPLVVVLLLLVCGLARRRPPTIK
jgi:hypothetical protein